MNSILFTEEFCRPENLYPFTLTRQLQDIRVGILTIREKWEKWLSLPSFDLKEDDYKDFEQSRTIADAVKNGICYMIHGNIIPDAHLVEAVLALQPGEFISANGNAGIIYCISQNEVRQQHQITVKNAVNYTAPIMQLQTPWQIFQFNDQAIRMDFELLTHDRVSAGIPSSVTVIGDPSQIFLEEGANLQYCTLNAMAGPLYLGKDAEIMEGSFIRGPFAMGEKSCVKMGAKIYAATSMGPYCIAAGEIKNSVMFGYSNKAHDGYLGDSVIGEWCNMGAGTTNSNLKNNAGPVRIWTQEGEKDAGQKCGVLMGDYSRTAINTSINTGTVIGVCCHVAGTGLTPKYIPNFSWGSDGVMRYQFEKALMDAEGWKKLKNQSLSEQEKIILKYIFDHL